MSEYETGVSLHEGGGKDPNEILNERVLAYVLARRGRLEPGDLHYEAVTAVPADGRVYKARRAWVAYALAAAAAGAVVDGAGAYGLGVTGLVALGMVLWVDLYGGLLHVVLDHPGHASHPVLGPVCVEFLWHHVLPYDIALRSFADVCGDISVLLGAHTALAGFAAWLWPALRPALSLCWGLAAGLGYCSQWSHRRDHAHYHAPSAHAVHHRKLTESFTILVHWTEPAIAWGRKRLGTSPDLWLGLWCAASALFVLGPAVLLHCATLAAI